MMKQQNLLRVPVPEGTSSFCILHPLSFFRISNLGRRRSLHKVCEKGKPSMWAGQVYGREDRRFIAPSKAWEREFRDACLRQAYAGIVRPGAALLVKNAILYES